MLRPMTTIHACRFWSDTGIELEAGRKYGLRAEGHWWDAFIRCSAAGYRNTLFRALENHRRVSGSDSFALIGSIDRDPAATFEIGTELLLTAPVPGACGALPTTCLGCIGTTGAR